jgi:hypothetical protein
MRQAYTDHKLKVRIDAIVAHTRRLVRNTKEILETVQRQAQIQRGQLEGSACGTCTRMSWRAGYNPCSFLVRS